MNLDNLTLTAIHAPEPNGGPFTSIQDALAHGYDTMNPVTGTIQIGVTIDGAFIPLFVEKASLVHDAIELAKVNAATNERAQPDTSGSSMGQNVPPAQNAPNAEASPGETPPTVQPQG